MADNRVQFRPVQGTEEQILGFPQLDYGTVYYATDTGKMYVDDFTTSSRVLIGGNTKIFYGHKKIDWNYVDTGTTVFDFKGTEIESPFGVSGEHDSAIAFNPILPAVNDLILNEDGGFYKVIEVDSTYDVDSATITAKKLTISGTGSVGGNTGGGNGDGSGDEATGEFKVEWLGNAKTLTTFSTLYGDPSTNVISFDLTSKDAFGSPVDSWYTIYVGPPNTPNQNMSQWPNTATTFAAENGTNHIDLLPILTAPGEAKKIRIVISNGVNNPASKSFTVTATDVKASWNYDNATINDVNEPITFSWSVSGSSSIKKIITFNVGSYSRTFTNNETDITFVPSEEGFKHGVYSASLHVDVELTGGTQPANTINKNVMFVDYDDPDYADKSLVSINYFEQNITQYDTIKIPISIYVPGNTGSANIEVYKPNSDTSIPIKNVKNGVEAEFLFTPDTAGTQKLTAYAGIDGEDSIIFDVQALNIDNAEVAGYTLKFAANAFSGNDEVKSWAEQTFKTKTENGQPVNVPMATFSERFDWINGGLTPIEDLDDNGNPRQYFCIKAGSTMTLNYPLFEAVAQQKGKAVKIIFKATNCRDYDAPVLSCKTPIKRVLVTPLETFLPALEGTDLTLYPDMIVNAKGELEFEGTSVTVTAFDSGVKDIWKTCVDKYLKHNDKYYRGRELTDSSYVDEEGNPIPYFGWYPVSVEDTFIGLDLKAQSASYKNGANIGLTTQYCEDSYIELELDISKVDAADAANPKNYIKFWIDGIPSGFAIYGRNNSFSIGDIPITIGSADCDVYIYMIKVYEQALIDNEDEKKYDHLKNFIADAPNSAEMIARYNRNNIMDERTFSPTLIAQNNPNCLVHVYTLSDKGMTTAKKDVKAVTSYKQYHGSGTPVLQANDITIKVQGTSSESYVLAAANIDTDFGDKMRGMPTKDHPDGEPMPDGWSMDGGKAIPVNFFCTKVNVASCENANNVLNQEWYNAFQPYQSVLRCKNPRARDTMQFTNGVIFMEDHNNQNGAFDLTKTGSAAKSNNLFAEIAGYKDNPHPRFYSLGQMGNSKDNVHVCHDLENPLECCMEVRDNQEPEQWMVNDDYNKADAGQKEKLFEFRYPSKSSDSTHVNGWNRLVTWMSHSNPQAKYEEHQANNQKDFEAFSINYKTHQPVPVFTLNSSTGVYEACDSFKTGITTYYTETPSVYGHTNLPLPDYKLTEDYEPETFREYFILSEGGDYIPYDAITQGFHYDENGNNDTYEKVVKTFAPYTFTGFKTDLRDGNGQLWQKNYEPLIAGCTIDTYAATYTHDTYEYRMAKMISECEHYLIMDSVLFHYLFIERHCMIDNVAKNTFWSTEDCKHWGPIKDYDNDTSDGNDNNGKFTRTYGLEPLDSLNINTMVFNAHRSVWLQFSDGLQTALEWMNTKLEEKTAIINGRTVGVWNKDDYLAVFKEWQSRIPERCWIEDYRRKYFRPYELYSETLFLEMMEGGKKEHQRKQFETYQNTYMSSKYFGTACEEDHALVRGNGQGMLNYQLPIKVYSDCYVYLRVGSETAGGVEVFDKNNIKKTRVKRNTEAFLICPSNNLNNAVIKIHPLSAYQTIGNPTTGKGLGAFEPDQLTVAGAPKLRELVITTLGGTTNQTLKNLNLGGNRLLEKLYACQLQPTNTTSGFPLNLNQCPSLRYIDGRNSFFDDISFADGAPIETILLEKPTALKLHNMYNLQTLHINDYKSLTQLDIIDIDSNPQLKDNNGALMSSQVLMNNSRYLSNYKFNDVKWRLTEAGSVDADTKSIGILDRLLALRPLELIEDDGSGATHEAVKDALTGNLTIAASAYNGSDSFEIYSKYVKEAPDIETLAYPDLDIDFEGSNAKLYEITIVDGDDKVIWKHKVNSSMAGLTTEFLATGPSGAFNIDKVKKAPFQNWVYEHNGTWTVYEANPLNAEENTLDVLDTINSAIPTYTFVENNTKLKDLLIKPNFTQKDRTYTLTFYNEAGDSVIEQTTVMAGAAIKTGYPATIPSKDDPAMDENKIYVFIGYGEFPNNDSVVDQNKAVNDDIGLYPKFREVSIYEMYNYANMEDYFVKTNSSYIESNRLPDSIKDQADSQYDISSGYNIALKAQVSGKILVPSTWTDGKPVIGVYMNAMESTGGEITVTRNGENLQYVFFERNNNNLRMYNQSAFQGMGNLKKVVNQPAKLRIIGDNCFQGCSSLETSIFNGELISIGNSAFNMAYDANNQSIAMILGSKIMYIGNYAFSNMDRTSMTFEIGEQNNKSALNLSKCGAPPLIRNNNNAESLTWYTDLYNLETDEIVIDNPDGGGEPTVYTVKEYFPGVNAIYFNPQT